MEALEIIGVIVGLVYLWLEYKANSLLWIAGIIMPAIYIFIYYNAGLYADFGINIYYLLIAVYGYMSWMRVGETTEKKELPITKLRLKLYLPLSLIFVALFVVIAEILIKFTNSDVPWLDSFTTAMSIIGMWLLAKKYVEQWIVWIAVDVVSSGLYIYKELYFTSVLYALYSIIAIFGYFNWIKLMKNEANRPI